MSDVKETLNSLAGQMGMIMTILTESGGELTTELEAIFDTVSQQLTEKADSYAYVLDKLEHEAAFYKAKADQFAKVSKGLLNVQDRMKQAIKVAMAQMGTDEVKGSDFRFKLSNSQPKLVIDELTLPVEYTITKAITEPNKPIIREMLESGLKIPGAALEPVQTLRKYVAKGTK